MARESGHETWPYVVAVQLSVRLLLSCCCQMPGKTSSLSSEKTCSCSSL